MRFSNLKNVIGFLFLIQLFYFGGFFIDSTSVVWAQSYRLDGSYFIRSSTHFFGEENKLGALTAGSTFRVVSKIPMRFGAEALEIEITRTSPGSYLKESPTGRFFILKADQKHFVKLNANEAPIKTESELEAQIGRCQNCNESASSPSNQSRQNQIALADVAQSVAIAQNQAPRINPPPESTPRPAMGPFEKGDFDDAIQRYSNSREVARMIEWAKKNNSKYSNGAGNCYLKVKEAMALQCANPPKGRKCTNIFYPEGGRLGSGNNLTKGLSRGLQDYYARSAKDRLKEQGFVNLLEKEPYKSAITSPSMAPKGAILVYSSGIPCSVNKNGRTVASTKDCGHIEIKTGGPGEKGYVSDYYSPEAINETPGARRYGSNYKLIGVMIKP